MSGKALPALRQVLWVAAGVVLLSLVVVAASWLFSPRPSGVAPRASAFKLPEQKVEKSTFQPEKPGATDSGERFKPEAGLRPQSVAPSTGSPKIDSTPLLEPAKPPRAATQASAAPPKAEPVLPSKAPAPQPPAIAKPQEPAAQPRSAPSSAAPLAAAARGFFGVQVGAFASSDNARSVKQKLEALGYKVALVSAGKATKVVVPGYSDRPAAERAQTSLKAAGYDGAFVVPLE